MFDSPADSYNFSSELVKSYHKNFFLSYINPQTRFKKFYFSVKQCEKMLVVLSYSSQKDLQILFRSFFKNTYSFCFNRKK